MKLNILAFTFLSILSFIFILTGCNEQARRDQNYNPDWFNQAPPAMLFRRQTEPTARTNAVLNNQQFVNPQPENLQTNNQKPKIVFKEITHDFGQISPSSSNICEFIFTNAGNANLVISGVESSCACTIPSLEKLEYAPGESGRLLAGYTDTQLGETIKHLYVHSNDPENPNIELSIKAQILSPVVYEPQKLDLSLMAKNADCPPIVVKSLDNRPFSITGFQSSGNCINIDFNPKLKAKEFVLQPRVNRALLEKIIDGEFQIALNHPESKLISGRFHATPRFSVSPRILTVNNAIPRETVTKKINIVSNYNENFDIQPLLSNRGIVSITSLRPTRAGYELTVEIEPPAASKNTRMFSDNIQLDIKGIEILDIQCNGYYQNTTTNTGAPDEDCKTCGPKIWYPGRGLVSQPQ